MSRVKTLRDARKRRHLRLRKRLRGTPERPRLSVFRSANHIYAQVVDDTTGMTLAAASSRDKDLLKDIEKLPKGEQSKRVGEAVAERAQGKGITAVIFDRGGYQYHGRVKAVAEGAREKGLQF